MIEFSGVVLFLSLILGSFSEDLERFNTYLTRLVFIVIVVVVLGGIFGLQAASKVFELKILGLLLLEIFAFNFVKTPKDVKPLIHLSTIPILQAAFFIVFFRYGNPDNQLVFLIIALVFDVIIKSNGTKREQIVKQVLLGVICFIAIILTTGLKSINVNFSVMLIIFWITYNMIPLGLSKDPSNETNYPLVPRLIILLLGMSNSTFQFPRDSIIFLTLVIGILSPIFITMIKSGVKSWSITKKNSELILLSIIFLISEKITQKNIEVIVCHSIYFFLPFVINTIKSNNYKKILLSIFCFFLLNGLFIGEIWSFFRNVLIQSETNELGMTILMPIISYWLITYSLVLRAPELPLEERNLNRFSTIFLSSIIITTLLISL